ncbi:MAG: sodium-dependent transporter [Clostridia bacterium]|nr:sodium-dependent transporter [Clostridia bacterium]
MRDMWNSSLYFIMTSVGAAVGLGNILRFPYLLSKYGFLFVVFYVVFLITLGLPLLATETAMGRMYRQGCVGCMKQISQKGSFLGFAMLNNSLFIMCYYGALFSFLLLMTFFAFKIPTLSSSEIDTFFYDITGYTGGATTPFAVIFLIIAWSVVCFCNGSAKRLGTISSVSVIFSFVLLLVLAVSGIMSTPGQVAKIFEINPNLLGSPQFWIDTAGQVLFSLSIMVGVMFAYGSFLKKSENIIKSVSIIAFVDLFVSLLASAIYLSVIKDGIVDFNSITTGFSVYPAAITSLTDSPFINGIIIFLFYLSLSLLSLDSMFSYLKSITVCIQDKFNISEERTTIVLSVLGLLVGFVFLGKGGLARMSGVDNLVCNFLLLIVGLFEVVIISKTGNLEDIRNEINLNSHRLKYPKRMFYLSINFLCPIAFIVLLILNI